MTVPKSLRDFDGDYQPAERFNRLPDMIKDTPLGLYVCEIKGVEMTETQGEVPSAICRFTLHLQQGPLVGIVCEWACWLNTQRGIDQLGADLATLGMDSATWNKAHKKRFSEELDKVLEGKKLVGLRFQGKRREYEKKDKPGEFAQTFDVSYLLPSRSPGGTAPAHNPAPAAFTQPPRSAKQSQPKVDDGIPF